MNGLKLPAAKDGVRNFWRVRHVPASLAEGQVPDGGDHGPVPGIELIAGPKFMTVRILQVQVFRHSVRETVMAALLDPGVPLRHLDMNRTVHGAAVVLPNSGAQTVRAASA